MDLRIPPPLALYVHLPWCVKRCPYCDFNSHEAPSSLPVDAYIDALKRDLEQELPDVWGRPLVSVFIGGGTPSLFPPEAIARLLSHVRALFNPDPAIEVTLEANPGTLEAERFRGYREAGVTRLSIGVQSFDDRMLARLGRIHDADQARAAIEAAAGAGFESFNIDLMYALPGQDAADALADLETAIALRPPHLSWYQLTLEPNTVFHSRPPANLPDDDAIAGIEAAGHAALARAGYGRYEISAWARDPLYRCAHNLNYWRFGDYIGIGAGAHGKITLPGDGTIERRARVRAPRSFLDRGGGRDCVAHRRSLSAGDAAFEFLLNALRLPEGFAPEAFAERTGVALTSLEKPLAEAVEEGLLQREPGVIRPTEPGLRYLNELLARFEAATSAWGSGRERIARIPVVTDRGGGD